MKPIYFNRPHLTGRELVYMKRAVKNGKISGDGIYTRDCQAYLEKTYSFGKVLLTNSCTDALEMAAMLCNIKEEDEVIAPSFTFVSSVNPFVVRGAKISFADSCADNPNMDVTQIEGLITDKTKAIVVVHYAGIACDMDKIMDIAKRHNLYVIEDAAQCIDSFYKKKALGSIGHLGHFHFTNRKTLLPARAACSPLMMQVLLQEQK